jgi:hypothetical protein
MVQRFNSIDELEEIVNHLDTAEQYNINMPESLNGIFEYDLVPGYKMIWNKTRDSVETIASSGYTLVQHREAFLPVVMGARAMNTNIQGFVTNEGGKVYIDILFDDQRFIINPEGGPIQLGLRFCNSYDRTAALSGKAFGFRIACSNGMLLSTTVSFHEIHRGEMSADMFSTLALKVAEKAPALNIAISEACKDYVESSVMQEVLLKIGIGKRRTSIILSRAFGLTKIHRWALYNMLTEMITHELNNKTELTRERYHECASKLLTQPIAEIIRK